jgi:uncharacterized PurR-regulated membrane protein YhhQ (DUF165 family)
MRFRAATAVALTVYIAAIVAANVLTSHFGLVPVGFGLFVPAGTYAAGFALLARDFVQRAGGVAWVFVGIAIGGVLSWWLASPGLALASVAAFTVAELADLAIYTPTERRRGFVAGALASNAVAAPIDTWVFLTIAGFPLTWQTFAGQMIGKLFWATLIPLLIYVGGRRALLREPVHAGGA